MGVVQILLPNVVRHLARPAAKGADPAPERVHHDHGACEATAQEAIDDLDDLGNPKDLSNRILPRVL
ncbi:hypothetical protein E2562_026906 [Oryza meyeriana var. granulata]|uniref:Uncharacterized protein n=1 Tax=Oryza meyeriana var. granulata TaxID=110450 RepID=A0A6G1CTD3_9ORYZ|nr:hypothetical protein E2562_026906 [Oryza meyeriana var. granulata]